MNAPSSGFFRDVSFGQRSDRQSHERFLLDTLAERRAEGKPAKRSWRSVLTSLRV